MDFKKYAENLGLEESDFRELTSLFIETTNADIQKLLDAVNEKNFRKAMEASHSIKGASGNLGFMDIWKAASVCEKASENHDLDQISSKTNEIKSMLTLIADSV